MGQVAFDTLQASEELETAGISREQAKAISLVVRKSHEVADVATKADIVELKHEIAEVNRNVADVRKDMDARFEKHEAQMQARFEKTDAQIADVRKDMAARFEKTEAKNYAQMALLRKDMEALASSLLIKLSKVMLAIVGISVTIATAIIKLL